MLLDGNHKFSGCPFQLEVVPPDVECKHSSVSALIEARGAVGLDQEELQLNIEMPRAGGQKGVFKYCVIADPDGVTKIEFVSSEGQWLTCNLKL